MFKLIMKFKIFTILHKHASLVGPTELFHNIGVLADKNTMVTIVLRLNIVPATITF